MQEGVAWAGLSGGFEFLYGVIEGTFLNQQLPFDKVGKRPGLGGHFGLAGLHQRGFDSPVDYTIRG